MKWENLPDFMRTEEVKEYYNILQHRRGSLVVKRAFDIVMSLILLVLLSLRKVRLDELPQLVNILKGEMSFVGTRPEVEKYVDAYTKEMYATLLMPAGVTSPASIEYKDEERLLTGEENPDQVYIEQILPEKMKYNFSYIRSFSFWKDLVILFQTVAAVLR